MFKNSVKQKSMQFFAPYSLRIILGLVLGSLSLFLFAKLSEDLLFNELQQFDKFVTSLIRSRISPTITVTMVYISFMGSPAILITLGIALLGYFLFIRKHVWDSVHVPIVLIGATLLNMVLKWLFHRNRPSLIHLVSVSGLSFPSGHAMISYSFYGLIIYLIWVNIDRNFFRYLSLALLSILILLIGISRIYLGVHYPSDVLAGFAAGSFWLIACILGLRGIRLYKSDRE